jgi:peroxiredoxin
MLRFVKKIIVDSFVSYRNLQIPKKPALSNGYKAYFFKNLLLNKKAFDTSINIVNTIIEKYSDQFRNNLLLNLFNDYSKTQNLSVSPKLEKVLGNFSIIDLAVFDRIRSSRMEGVKLRNFSLRNTEDEVVSLSDFTGKVVLIDFWYSGCPGCVDLYRNIVKNLEKEYNSNKNVVFLSVAIDSDKTTWQKSVKSGIYTNPNQNNVINLYSRKEEGNKLVTELALNIFPQAFLLNKKGVIISSSLANVPRDSEKYNKIKFLIENLISN